MSDRQDNYESKRPRRPLRLRRWACAALAALGLILALHIAGKAIPQAALDAVEYAP